MDGTHRVKLSLKELYVNDGADNVIEIHEHTADLKEMVAVRLGALQSLRIARAFQVIGVKVGCC